MGATCILTDSSAQFPQLGFSGRSEVRVVPFSVELSGQLYEEGRDLHTNDLPGSANDALRPRLIAPTTAALAELFQSLSQHYSDILMIVTSASLSAMYANALAASKTIQGRTRVMVIDSQTTSVGLGLLVQHAAEAVAAGKHPADVESIVRSIIPRIYMMVCTPALSYLSYAGFVDASQGFVGEMLNLMPIFTLEEGQLSAVEKVRNSRSLVDFMQEFVCEFDELEHIAFIQSIPPLTHEAKLMREHAQSCFAQTPFSEHNINVPLATLFGPRAVGLVAVEKGESRRG